MGAKGVTHFLRHFSKTVAFSILHETLNFPCTGMNIVVQVDHGGAMGLSHLWPVLMEHQSVHNEVRAKLEEICCSPMHAARLRLQFAQYSGQMLLGWRNAIFYCLQS